MLKHLPGKIMIADLLTKAVARPIFLELTRLYCGVCCHRGCDT